MDGMWESVPIFVCCVRYFFFWIFFIVHCVSCEYVMIVAVSISLFRERGHKELKMQKANNLYKKKRAWTWEISFWMWKNQTLEKGHKKGDIRWQKYQILMCRNNENQSIWYIQAFVVTAMMVIFFRFFFNLLHFLVFFSGVTTCTLYMCMCVGLFSSCNLLYGKVFYWKRHARNKKKKLNKVTYANPIRALKIK